MNSMTGYGQASWSGKSLAIDVVVRSVNNRFLKVVTHMPEDLEPIAAQVEETLRKHVDRGTVHVEVHVHGSAARALPEINEERLAAWCKKLRAVLKKAGIKEEPGLQALLSLPGVLDAPENGADAAELGPRVLKLVDAAAKKLAEMRRGEGARTGKEMTRLADALEAAVTQVRLLAPRVPAAHRDRMLERINALLAPGSLPVAPADLARELAIWADRCDISEELQRLGSHLHQLRALLKSSGEAGKKLDFLTQELLRETNTIGSKANDAEIAQIVIDMKSEIEKLKEQVQNVE